MTAGEVIFLLLIVVVFIIAFAWPLVQRGRGNVSTSTAQASTATAASSGKTTKAIRRILVAQRNAPRHAPARPVGTSLATIQLSIKHTIEDEDIDDYDQEREDDYHELVHNIWNKPGNIPLSELNCSVNGRHAILHSLSPRQGSPYVNLSLVETGERKTFVADRHRWAIDDTPIDPSAFRAILAGVEPKTALQSDPHPATPEGARLSDRFQTESKRFLLQYRSGAGEHWRVVSRLQRGDDAVRARCHFRWGENRSFRNDRIISLVDADTGETIDLAAYLSKRIALPRNARNRA